jgi:hypothetical protein
VIIFMLIMENLLLTKQDLHLNWNIQRTGENNNVIGDINADWKAGLNNSITYKNLNLSFLLDMQKEEMFSLLTHGMVTLQECMIFLPLMN